MTAASSDSPVIQGRPVRLRSGDWGVRVSGESAVSLRVGDKVAVEIVSRDEEKQWIQKSVVIWTGETKRGRAVALLKKDGGDRRRRGWYGKHNPECYAVEGENQRWTCNATGDTFLGESQHDLAHGL